MSTFAAPTVRCPACAATLRAGSDWCTLCYTDLRPPPPAPVPVAAPAGVPLSGQPADSSEPVTASNGGGEAGPVLAEPVAEVAPAPRRTRGKHARRDPADDVSSSSPDEVEALANQMLAQLAASESKNPLGPVAGAVDTTGKRAVLMVGGAVVAMLLIFILMAVLGALL